MLSTSNVCAPADTTTATITTTLTTTTTSHDVRLRTSAAVSKHTAVKTPATAVKTPATAVNTPATAVITPATAAQENTAASMKLTAGVTITTAAKKHNALETVQGPTTGNLEINSNTGKTCFEDVDLHDINDHLSTGLFWSTYTIIKSPADGHCFMHSVVTTFNANMSDNIGAKLDVDVLSAKLSNETMANSHEYMNYSETSL